ncbi:DUF3618 domain-containing protein [Streptomyces sp. RFCAC02]|uniref:DUF3618 domain-containing protein n=1 Tax=Streptomyces sp. RFCAC02 TaxID=2499143 RepID=UPI00101F3246|nr:DUF3618 domain-containing protein [Streptomyces sp. RFCAC02]
MPDAARTPAEIEAGIARRRQRLAETLDEIAVRVHPSTIAGDLKARAAATMDRSVGRALVTANRTVTAVRSQFVTPEGAPRMDRVVPVVVLAVAVGGLLVASTRRRGR